MWGRSGNARANALWGRGGRAAVLAVVAAITIVIPLGASADNGGKSKAPTFVAPGLLDQAEKNPGQKLHLIIQSSAGAGSAAASVRGLGSVRKQLDLIGAAAVDVPAARLKEIAKNPGLTITADAPIKLSAASVSYSDDMWPYESGNAKLWGTPGSPAPQAPTSRLSTDFARSGCRRSRTATLGVMIDERMLQRLGGIATSHQLRRAVLTGPFLAKDVSTTFTIVLDHYGEHPDIARVG